VEFLVEFVVDEIFDDSAGDKVYDPVDVSVAELELELVDDPVDAGIVLLRNDIDAVYRLAKGTLSVGVYTSRY
jgi:hypothetical protein